MTPLAAIAALALAAGTEEKPSPFAGCTAVQEDGTTYRCRGLDGRIEDGGDASLPGYDKGGALALARAAGCELSQEARTLGGQQVQAWTGRARDGSWAFWVVRLPRPEGARVLTCAAKEDARRRCDVALEWMARRPWREAPAPDASRSAPAPATLAGDPVQVPDGCRVASRGPGGAIDCGAPLMAGWAELENEASARRFLDTTWEAILGLDAPELSGKRDEVPCRLARVPTTCRRIRWSLKGSAMWAVAAIAPKGGKVLSASCIGPPGGPPCSVVFELPAE